MVRLAALLALAALVLSAHASEAACGSAVAGEAIACEQRRAEQVLSALSERYARVWAQLPSERRSAFAAAERRWLNGGRWDDHAACVAAGADNVAADVVAARCLADVTAAHLESLNGAATNSLGVRIAAPQR